MTTYIKSEVLTKEESNAHLVEYMVYIPPMKNGSWFVKDEFRSQINSYWKHNEGTYMSGMYGELP